MLHHVLARGIIPPPSRDRASQLRQLVEEGKLDQETADIVVAHWEEDMKFRNSYGPHLQSLGALLKTAFITAKSPTELGAAVGKVKGELPKEGLSLFTQALHRMSMMLTEDKAATLKPLPAKCSRLDRALYDLLVPCVEALRARWAAQSRAIAIKRLGNLERIFGRALDHAIFV